MKREAKLVVAQVEDEPVPEEVLAAAIIKISVGFERAMKTGLTRRALSLLIKDMLPSPSSSQPSLYQIGMVLQALPSLAAVYVPKKK